MSLSLLSVIVINLAFKSANVIKYAGLVTPIIVALLTHYRAPAKLKAVVGITVAGLVVLIQRATRADGVAVIDAGFVKDFALVYGVQIATYLGVWQHFGLNGAIFPTLGIGKPADPFDSTRYSPTTVAAQPLTSAVGTAHEIAYPTDEPVWLKAILDGGAFGFTHGIAPDPIPSTLFDAETPADDHVSDVTQTTVHAIPLTSSESSNVPTTLAD